MCSPPYTLRGKIPKIVLKQPRFHQKGTQRVTNYVHLAKESYQNNSSHLTADDQPCKRVVCQNGGTCVDEGIGINDFRCQCTSGWHGTHCDGILPFLSFHLLHERRWSVFNWFWQLFYKILYNDCDSNVHL